MSATAYEVLDRSQFMAKALSKPASYDDTRENRGRSIARRIGLSYRQFRRIIDRDVKTIPAHVWIRLNELYEAECLRAEQAADLMEARARERRAKLESDDAAVLEPAPSIPGVGSELEAGDDRADEEDGQAND